MVLSFGTHIYIMSPLVAKCVLSRNFHTFYIPVSDRWEIATGEGYFVPVYGHSLLTACWYHHYVTLITMTS